MVRYFVTGTDEKTGEKGVLMYDTKIKKDAMRFAKNSIGFREVTILEYSKTGDLLDTIFL
jgi:hypothetical protein